MKATASSWECISFEDGVPINVEVQGAIEDFSKIEMGFLPEEMEDKWFMYFQSPYLFLHRSWTGQPVYRIELERTEQSFEIKEALLSSDLAEESDLEYQGKLAKFLVSNILLDRHIDFPMPTDIKELSPGVFQHLISGTGYKEDINSSKPWWKFW